MYVILVRSFMTLAWKWHARDAFAEECGGLGFWKMHVGCREDGRDVEEVAKECEYEKIHGQTL